MKSKKAALGALTEPLTCAQAAKLMGVTPATIEAMVRRLDLLVVEVRGRKLIPACELQRFQPR